MFVIVVFAIMYTMFLLYIIIKPVTQETEELFPGSGRRVLCNSHTLRHDSEGNVAGKERTGMHMENGDRRIEMKALIPAAQQMVANDNSIESNGVHGDINYSNKSDGINTGTLPQHWHTPSVSQDIGSITRDVMSTSQAMPTSASVESTEANKGVPSSSVRHTGAISSLSPRSYLHEMMHKKK